MRERVRTAAASDSSPVRNLQLHRHRTDGKEGECGGGDNEAAGEREKERETALTVAVGRCSSLCRGCCPQCSEMSTPAATHAEHPPNSLWWCQGLDLAAAWCLVEVTHEQQHTPTLTQPWSVTVTVERVPVPDSNAPAEADRGRVPSTVLSPSPSPSPQPTAVSPLSPLISPDAATGPTRTPSSSLSSPSPSPLRDRGDSNTTAPKKPAAPSHSNPHFAFIVKSDDGLEYTVPPTLLVPFEKVADAKNSQSCAARFSFSRAATNTNQKEGGGGDCERE